VYSLPIEIVSSDDAVSEVGVDDNAELQPRDLVNRPAPLLKKRGVKLVRSVKLLKRNYARNIGGCSGTQIQNAQAQCRTKCAETGRQSRGINYCKSEGGRASASCACSGAAPAKAATACRSCQWAFQRKVNASYRCDQVADARGEFYRCIENVSGDCATPRAFC